MKSKNEVRAIAGAFARLSKAVNLANAEIQQLDGWDDLRLELKIEPGSPPRFSVLLWHPFTLDLATMIEKAETDHLV